MSDNIFEFEKNVKKKTIWRIIFKFDNIVKLTKNNVKNTM